MSTLASPVEEDLLSRTLAFCSECLNREDMPAAWQALCRAVTLAPDNPGVLNHRGRLALFMNNRDAAKSDFAEALRIDRRSTAALAGLARCHLLKGELAEAKSEAAFALSINPADEEASQVIAELATTPTRSREIARGKVDVGLSHAPANLTLSLLYRIKDAYLAANQQNQDLNVSLGASFAERHRNIHNALTGDEVETLLQILKNPGQSDLFYGFEAPHSEGAASQKITGSEKKKRELSFLLAGLARLGEALGVRRQECAEHKKSNFHPSPLEDVESLLRELDVVCGFRLEFPNPFPNEFGILTSRGICSFGAIQALYQAWRIRELSRIYGKKILEIGAGLGRTAYYARKFGVTDYTIVDLPIATTAQALFLGLVAGSDAVSLPEENREPEQIRIMSPEALFTSGESFDLIVNVDSLTEMDVRFATRYTEFAGLRAKAVLSINHEAGAFKARELLRASLQPMQRHPYWMRDGYSEELFTSNLKAIDHGQGDPVMRAERDAARAERDAARQSIHGQFSTEVAHSLLSLDAHVPSVTDRAGHPIFQPPELMFPPHYFRPLNVSINPALADSPRLNILLPSTSAAHNSGGPNTAYLLAAQLAKAGVPLRIVAVNISADADSTAIRAHIIRLSGVSAELINGIEMVDGSNRSSPLVLGENDIFFATAWWTAQMVKYLLPRFRHERFIYLIQDYEPNLHPISTNSMLALETYSLNYLPVVNSRLLFDHFVTEKVGRFANADFVRTGCWFEPSVDRKLYFPETGTRQPNGKRRLMIYARPDAPRNLLELGIAALMRLLAEGSFKADEWEFFSTQTGIGGSCRPVRLSTDGKATLVPLALQELTTWASEMRRTDVLLSLIWSPHTSYPVLEGAASGAMVVTNSCGVKDSARLRQLSPNIIAGVPSIEGVAEALMAAAARTGDWPALNAGAQMGLPTNWEQSFADCVPRLIDFLQQSGVALSRTAAARAC